MELVEALELLSLEVRNQKFNTSSEHNALSEVHSAQSHPNQQYDSQSIRQQSSNTDILVNNDQHLRQFQEFDKSIKTLFAQLTDLDCFEPKRTIKNTEMPNLTAFSRRERFNQLYRTNSRAHYNGSMETSQEEDSDCSSQQSGCANGSKRDACINPLVKDLLERDTRAITDTVKKIGRILAIGHQLETLRNNLFSNMEQHTQGNNPYLNNLSNIDAAYIKSLCNEFDYLCSSEQHISDLPTIITYNELCCNLLAMITKLEPYSNSARYQTQPQNTQYSEDENFLPRPSDPIEVSDNNGNLGLSIELDEEELSDDSAFLNCDQRHVDNWTENKLYINHQST